MFLLEVGFWEVAGDCVQIILCLLILLFFIRNRKKQKQQLPRQTIKNVEKSFNEQVFTQTVQQQIEQAFANIMEGLAAERDNLKRLLGDDHSNRANEGVSRMGSLCGKPHNPLNRRIPAKTADSDQRLEKILKFSLKGMSARKISDELKVPLSEVELVLSLQKE